MEKIRGNILIHNGKQVDPGSYQLPESTGLFYEVIRLHQGRLMFLDDHLTRLSHSCIQANTGCPGITQIKESLDTLMQVSPFHEGNIKIIVYRSGGSTHLDCFFVPHRYPTPEEYQSGVRLKTFRFTRPDPTIKRWNAPFREQVNAFIANEKIYEAILVNETGSLTEGSRSNLFFIHPEGDVVTAPEDVVLPGITRMHVLKYCLKHHLKVSERLVRKDEINSMAACFITGTSPMVLPVRQLDDVVFDVKHPLLRSLVKGWQPH